MVYTVPYGFNIFGNTTVLLWFYCVVQYRIVLICYAERHCFTRLHSKNSYKLRFSHTPQAKKHFCTSSHEYGLLHLSIFYQPACFMSFVTSPVSSLPNRRGWPGSHKCHHMTQKASRYVGSSRGIITMLNDMHMRGRSWYKSASVAAGCWMAFMTQITRLSRALNINHAPFCTASD